jgi:DNA primase
MNCEQANQIDLVEYLRVLGFTPKKISREDHWYLSPLRKENQASFKVNKNKNAWYDHGLGKGGRLIDFAMEYYRCNVYEALQKIFSFHKQNSFQNNVARPTIHLHENNLLKNAPARELSIKIIAAKQPIQDLMLCSYLKQRRIDKKIADKYCYEVAFKNAEKENTYKAIGFKNNAGGYELRNEYFKGSSSPKYVNYLDNHSNTITVFEGFFDFLSYQTIQQNQASP